MRNCPKSRKDCVKTSIDRFVTILPVKQHGGELDDNNGKEEEHKHDTNGLKVEIFLGDENLGKYNIVIELIMMHNLLN